MAFLFFSILSFYVAVNSVSWHTCHFTSKSKFTEMMIMEEIKEGYLRVSSVLQPFSDYDKIPAETLANACARGTKVHLYCENYAKGIWFPEPDKEYKGYVDSFMAWHDKMVEKVLCIEERFYNDTYMITGRIDEIAILKGDSKASIIDYKTPAIANRSWALQMAGYRFIANGDIGLIKRRIFPQRRIALKLSKTGGRPKIVEYTDYLTDWSIYKGILNAVRFYE